LTKKIACITENIQNSEEKLQPQQLGRLLLDELELAEDDADVELEYVYNSARFT